MEKDVVIVVTAKFANNLAFLNVITSVWTPDIVTAKFTSEIASNGTRIHKA